jgi:hypothetical protein
MSDWADTLTDKLLAESPQDKPFRAIMADALRDERKRALDVARHEKDRVLVNPSDDYKSGYFVACHRIEVHIAVDEE